MYYIKYRCDNYKFHEPSESKKDKKSFSVLFIKYLLYSIILFVLLQRERKKDKGREREKNMTCFTSSYGTHIIVFITISSHNAINPLQPICFCFIKSFIKTKDVIKSAFLLSHKITCEYFSHVYTHVTQTERKISYTCICLYKLPKFGFKGVFKSAENTVNKYYCV